MESTDEMLMHRIELPDLNLWKDIVLFIETSEEIPSHNYTKGVLRALGELGYLEGVKGLLVGRPMSCNFDIKPSLKEKNKYKKNQFNTIVKILRVYNQICPIIGNMDFGHTKPQVCVPSGNSCKILIEKNNFKVFFKF